MIKYKKIFDRLESLDKPWTLKSDDRGFCLVIWYKPREGTPFVGDTLDECLQDFVKYLVSTGGY